MRGFHFLPQLTDQSHNYFTLLLWIRVNVTEEALYWVLGSQENSLQRLGSRKHGVRKVSQEQESRKTIEDRLNSSLLYTLCDGTSFYCYLVADC